MSPSAPLRWSIAPYFLVDDVVATANYYRDRDRDHAESGSRDGCRAPQPRRVPSRDAWDAYVWIEDADDLYTEFRSRGVKITREICDQPYGCRDFDIDDCNGYRLCFGQDIESA